MISTAKILAAVPPIRVQLEDIPFNGEFVDHSSIGERLTCGEDLCNDQGDPES
jgi:hypothetical protein